MVLRIRLRKQGRTNRPFYRVVVCESTTRRDGRYVEALGWYNPVEIDESKNLLLKGERIQHWLDQGAQLTENVESLVARGAPDVMRARRESQQAHQQRVIAKRKAKKSKTAAK